MNPNASAFPNSNRALGGLQSELCDYGLTKREYIAARVLPVLIASNGVEVQMLQQKLSLSDLPKFCAEIAVECADALIAELARPTTYCNPV